MLANFRTTLLEFLIYEGYSHIYKISARDISPRPYILEAIKSDDPRLQWDEVKMYMEDIMSDEIQEMAYGMFGMEFMLEIPDDVHERFLKT